MTIPAGTYDATAFVIPGLSIAPDTLIESDETMELGMLTGSQIQVGDANGDGTIQAVTQYAITDDDLQRVQTSVELPDASRLTITDIVPGGKNDQLKLTIVGNNFVISDSNNILGNFADGTTGNVVDVPLASLQSIELNLAGGDDRLSIDFSGAPQGLSLSVTINGGDGHDTLIFSGATSLGSGELRTNDEVEDVFVNGPITMQSGTIVLTAVQSLEVNADISLGTGSFQLAVGRDVFGNCSLIQAGDADVHLVSGTGIAGVRIATIGDVSLNGGSGGIVGCTGEMAVRAQTLTLVTGSSVGTAFLRAGKITDKEPLRTSVDIIEGTIGGMGIFLLNDRPLIDNVVLVDAPPLGIRHVRSVPSGGLNEGEGSPLHNAANRLDVNDDGSVSPIDVLAVVNYLNAAGARVQSEGPSENQVRLYVDVNGDRAASALDALIIINYLNMRTAVQAEGEAMVSNLDLSASHHVERFFRSHLSPTGSVQSRLSFRGWEEIDVSGFGSSHRLFNHALIRQEPAVSAVPLTNSRRDCRLSLYESTPLRGAKGDTSSSHRNSRLPRTTLKTDEAAQQWDSLLNELAEDASRALYLVPRV